MTSPSGSPENNITLPGGKGVEDKAQSIIDTLQRIYDRAHAITQTDKERALQIEKERRDTELLEKLIENLKEDIQRIQKNMQEKRKEILTVARQYLTHRRSKEFFYGNVQYERRFKMIFPFINDISTLRYPEAKGNLKFESKIDQIREKLLEYALGAIQNIEDRLEFVTRVDTKNGAMYLNDEEAKKLLID